MAETAAGQGIQPFTNVEKLRMEEENKIFIKN